jgi:hypothetical protein
MKKIFYILIFVLNINTIYALTLGAIKNKDLLVNTDNQTVKSNFENVCDSTYLSDVNNETIKDISDSTEISAQEISDFFDKYTGSEADRKKAAEYQAKANKKTQMLLNDPEVSEEDKIRLRAAYDNAQPDWENLKNGIPCPDDSQEKGIILDEDGYFVTPDEQLVKLNKGTEILYFCDYKSNLLTGFLYKFKTDSKVWISKGTANSSSGKYNFEGYYSDGQKYADTGGSYVTKGDEVWMVEQNANYQDSTVKRELTISKIRIFETGYSNFYDKSTTLTSKTNEIKTNCE